MRPLLAIALLAVPLGACERAGPAAEREKPAQGDVGLIAATDLAARMEAGEIALIDVRTPEEFAEGHIAGAVNIPLDTFDADDYRAADGREPVLYCRSDRRSGEAAQKVAMTGRDAIHLDGGILAWEDAGLPVTPPTR